MKKEVVSSYPINCPGKSPAGITVSSDISTVPATIDIFKDGTRQVGCSFLNNKYCEKFGKVHNLNKCVQLYPEHS